VRVQQLNQVCDALGLKAGRVSNDWLAVSCPMSHWTHTGGANSDNARGVKASGGFSVSTHGKSKFMCRTCQHTPLSMWELYQRIEWQMAHQPVNRVANLEMFRALINQEAANVVDDLEIAAHELMGKVRDGEDGDFQADVRTRPWPEEFLLNYEPVLEVPEAHNYCTVRAIPDVVIEHLGMVWDPKQRRICFPVRDESWQLVGLHGRVIDDYRPLLPEWEGHPDPEVLLEQNPNCRYIPDREPLRYYAYACQEVRNTHIWCNQHLVDMEEPVIITEGNFDYARIMAAGFYNVLGSRSAGIHGHMLKYLEKAHTIITYYDRGAGGDEARKRVSKYFEGSGRIVRHITPSELDDDAGNTPACIIQQNIGRFII